MQFSLRRGIVTLAAVMMLVLAFASTSFAGEDDGCDDDSCSSAAGSGGGSDTGSATGGAQTGLGGAVVKSDGSMLIPLTLAGGSVVLLTLAGAAGMRARRLTA
jgi:hypothetical protein